MSEVRVVLEVPDRVVDLLERMVTVMEDTYDLTLRPREEDYDDEIEVDDAD